MLSFVDTAGEDLNDLGTAFTLQYLSVCDALIITLDPFALPGARARLNLPQQAIQVDDDVPLDVVSRITELLRTEHKVKNKKKIKLPVAIVFTKIDAFYPSLDRQNPIMARPPGIPAYEEADGQTVHEHMLALMHEWNAADIDTHMRLNYSDYRYFGVSALGAEPDYAGGVVAPGGVQPHRVEDPVLWLLSKTRTVPVDMTAGAFDRLLYTDCRAGTGRGAGGGFQVQAQSAGVDAAQVEDGGRLAAVRRARTRGSWSGARSGTSRSGSRTRLRPATGRRRAATWATEATGGRVRATTSPTACSPGTRTCTARSGPRSCGGRLSGGPRRGTAQTARSSMTRRPGTAHRGRGRGLAAGRPGARPGAGQAAQRARGSGGSAGGHHGH